MTSKEITGAKVYQIIENAKREIEKIGNNTVETNYAKAHLDDIQDYLSLTVDVRKPSTRAVLKQYQDKVKRESEKPKARLKGATRESAKML